jgi:hypothetical protein
MRGRDLLSLSFRVVALVFVALAGGAAVNTWIFLANSVETVGVVTGFDTRQNAIGLMPEGNATGIISYPVVEYRSGSETYQLTGRSGVSVDETPPGTQVRLRVSGADPGSARIATLMGTWGSPIILAAIGVLFVLLGVLAPFGFGGAREQS